MPNEKGAEAVLVDPAKHAAIDTIALRQKVANAVLAQDRYPFEGTLDGKALPNRLEHRHVRVRPRDALLAKVGKGEIGDVMADRNWADGQ